MANQQVNEIVNVILSCVVNVTPELREVVQHGVSSELGRFEFEANAKVIFGRYNAKKAIITTVKQSAKVGGKGDEITCSPITSLVAYITRLLEAADEFGTFTGKLKLDLAHSRWNHVLGTWQARAEAKVKAKAEAKAAAEAEAAAAAAAEEEEEEEETETEATPA